MTVDQATVDAMADPQPGDYFHEMLAYRIFVVARDGDALTTLTLRGGGTVPNDCERRHETVKAFQSRHAYDNIPGYWVRLAKRGIDVTGWADSGHPAADPPPPAVDQPADRLAAVTAERDRALAKADYLARALQGTAYTAKDVAGLTARLDAVAAIHYEVRGQFVQGSWCHGCPSEWPCATHLAAFPEEQQ